MSTYSNDADTHILHFSLQGVLDPEQILAMDTRNELIVLLTRAGENPHLLASVQLTQSESCILLPLLEAFPFHCPYEVLVSSMNGRPKDSDIARARARLEAASLEGVWDAEMRPVRNLLSRTRLKIRELNIDILAIIEVGYMLSRCHQETHQ